MPKIIVQEQNLTNPSGAGVGTDIAYVPGLMGCAKDGSEYEDGVYNTPILCASIDEFETYFGPKEPTYQEDFTIGRTEFRADSIDLSYVFAKELLNSGLPVLYEAIKYEPKNIYCSILNNGSYNDNTVNNSNEINVYYYETLDGAGLSIRPTECRIPLEISGDGTTYKNLESGESYTFSIETSVASNVVTGMYLEVNDKKVSDMDNEGYIPFTTITATPSTFNLVVEYASITDVPNSPELTDVIGNVKLNVTKSIEVLPFEYAIANAPTEVEYIYEVLPERLDRIADKSEYQVKYITAGAYPTFRDDSQAMAHKLIATAASRGDAVAIVDHEDLPNKTLIGVGSMYNTLLKNAQIGDGTYGTMFTPYGSYNCTTISDVDHMVQIMPASFAYLNCLARTIKTSPNWLAIAGVTRGIVNGINGLHTKQTLNNTIADLYQPVENGTAINAITDVKPYGLTIWGNRTLEKVGKGLTATSFLNTRNMISDVKKLAYSTAKSLMFEQNTETLWLRFKSGLVPFLEQLKSGGGISAYQLNKLTTKYNKQPLGKGEMACSIKIYPIYAVEQFEITVVLADEEVSVS